MADTRLSAAATQSGLNRFNPDVKTRHESHIKKIIGLGSGQPQGRNVDRNQGAISEALSPAFTEMAPQMEGASKIIILLLILPRWLLLGCCARRREGASVAFEGGGFGARC